MSYAIAGRLQRLVRRLLDEKGALFVTGCCTSELRRCGSSQLRSTSKTVAATDKNMRPAEPIPSRILVRYSENA